MRYLIMFAAFVGVSFAIVPDADACLFSKMAERRAARMAARRPVMMVEVLPMPQATPPAQKPMPDKKDKKSK